VGRTFNPEEAILILGLLSTTAWAKATAHGAAGTSPGHEPAPTPGHYAHAGQTTPQPEPAGPASDAGSAGQHQGRLARGLPQLTAPG
jgi:hypothetical protein